MPASKGAGVIRTRLWIGNEWVGAEGGNTFVTVNPATEAVIAEVSEAGTVDIDRAVEAARAAFCDSRWRRMNPHRRSRLLWRLADLVEANADEIARVECLDMGFLEEFLPVLGRGNHPQGAINFHMVQYTILNQVL